VWFGVEKAKLGCNASFTENTQRNKEVGLIETFCSILVTRHFSEGLIKFIGDGLEFLLLVDQLI